jgi:hypothetical protein
MKKITKFIKWERVGKGQWEGRIHTVRNHMTALQPRAHFSVWQRDSTRFQLRDHSGIVRAIPSSSKLMAFAYAGFLSGIHTYQLGSKKTTFKVLA